LNLHPRAGEQAEYHDQYDADKSRPVAQKYSVITMMPGIGAGRRILTLNCPGVRAARRARLVYFHPDMVRDLVGRMRTGGTGVPDFFQILVRAEYKSKAVVKVDYITHRSFEDPVGFSIVLRGGRSRHG